MKEIEKLIELSAKKHQIDIKRADKKYLDSHWILENLLGEVEEVKEELKANNIAHLEDELSDVLWDWMILIENLKDEGYITSHQNIIKRALKKYEERILPLHGDDRDYEIWKQVKVKQKLALDKEAYI